MGMTSFVRRAVPLLLCAAAAGCAKPTGPVIVYLVSRDQVVTVRSGPRGPVYRVEDGSGVPTITGATLPELRSQHPDVYRRLQPSLSGYELDASLGTDHAARPEGTPLAG